MRVICALLVLLLPGCAFQMAISNQGFAVLGTLADVRVGWKSSRAGDVEVEASKEQASEQFMEMVEETLPGVVDAAVKAALLSAGIGAAGALLSPVPELPLEEVPDGE
jgi:hypothetical protein